MRYQPLLALIMRTIEDAFDTGRFLSSLHTSLCSQGEFNIHIPVSVVEAHRHPNANFLYSQAVPL